MFQRLVAACLMGCLVVLTGCGNIPGEEEVEGMEELGELGEFSILMSAQSRVGTPPVSMEACVSDAPCTMPLIAAGSGHTVALKNDGTVWAWGYGLEGQLGDGTWADRNKPVQVEVSNGVALTSIIAVAAGMNHTVALKANGTVGPRDPTTTVRSGMGRADFIRHLIAAMQCRLCAPLESLSPILLRSRPAESTP